MTLSTHLHLVQRTRIRGDKYPLTHTSSWHVFKQTLGQLSYFSPNFQFIFCHYFPLALCLSIFFTALAYDTKVLFHLVYQSFGSTTWMEDVVQKTYFCLK
jgi:hypothetical protein